MPVFYQQTQDVIRKQKKNSGLIIMRMSAYNYYEELQKDKCLIKCNTTVQSIDIDDSTSKFFKGHYNKNSVKMSKLSKEQDFYLNYPFDNSYKCTLI